MTKLEALEASVEHWEENLTSAERGRAPHVTTGSCALCMKYLVAAHSCEECPLYQYGFRCLREGSPYKEVLVAMRELSLPPRARNRDIDLVASVWAMYATLYFIYQTELEAACSVG